MSNSIVPVNLEDTKLPVGMDREDLQAFVSTLDSSGKLSWSQVKVFLHQCHEMRLDPRRKHIYAIPRWNKNTGRMDLTTVVSIDGFRLVAERTERYAPGSPTKYHWDNEGRLVGATVFVKKMTSDGTWHEVSETAFISEYMPERPSTFWRQMPSVMIAKVAEARALRRAFPDTFSGIYSKDEMDQGDQEDQTSQAIVDLCPVEPKPEDRVLSDKAFEKLMTLLDGDSDLEKRVKEICGLTDLRNMRYSQCESVKKFVDRYRSKNEEVVSGTEA